MSELHNAIVALTDSDAQALTDYRAENGGMLPPTLPRISWAGGVWRNPAGYVVYDVQSANLEDLDVLMDAYPDTRVYGVWHRETGEPIRPLRDDCIDLMPDVVEYDETGNEADRTRPTTCRDVHLWAGQHPRNWRGH